MPCSSCGSQNEPGRKFCGECGAHLTLACPSCGSSNPPGTKFCGECGIALGSVTAGIPSSPTTSNGPLAERRLVSVLFADLVGFTTLSEARDAEEVRDLLSRYFETSRAVIARYGGVVEKFIGDAVMAVWGTPTTMEDDAERAVRAALELVDAVSALGEEVGAPALAARAGVLTGEAAVNLAAVGEGMVAGDLVNTAARIQSSASPGAVYVGEATRRASDAAIVYEEAGTHELKGKSEPVALWRATRVVTGIRGSGRSSALEPPFLGRDRELRMLKDLFHASGEGRKAQLLTVIGGAGLGKSRLVWEFQKYIDGLAIDTRWHRGRCLAYGEGVTFWALAEMVRTNASIVEGEDQATALPKLRAAVEYAIPDPEERRWVEPRLASLLGLESGPTRDREDLFAAWRRFYERLSDEMPTALVFEDIHWADPSLLDFIEYLLEWSRSYPIFVLAVGRPGATVRNSATIHLDPLPGSTMGDLLEALVPGLPTEVGAQVLERSEGVPLYAVETVRMLLDKGLLAHEGNAYRPTGPIEELDVPETLHGLIAARLDGLDPEERRLVQDAAVLGKTFTERGLLAVAGIRPDELVPRLATLVRREIFTVLEDPLSPERGQYSFLGDLIRWVAYETLSKKERKVRHLAVATYLEEAFEEEDVVEVVASHYLQAFGSAPDADDAVSIKDRARGAVTRAGERAASLGAAEEARRYFEQGIDLTDDLVTRAELHERAAEMALMGGDADSATAHYERAMQLFRECGLTHAEARASAGLADVDRREGRLDQGLERMAEAFAVLAAEEPDEDLAMLAAQLGRFLFFAGRATEAAERTEFALTIAEGLRLPRVFSEALNTKSLILDAQERSGEAYLLLQHSLEVALDNDLGASALRAYNNLCAFMNRSGRHEDELRAAADGLELARRLGNRSWAEVLLACHIAPLGFMGRWEEALARGAEVQAYPEFARSPQLVAECALLMQVHVSRGELDEARELLRVIDEQAVGADLAFRATQMLARAQLARADCRFEEALEFATNGFDLSSEIGNRDAVVTDSFGEAVEAAFALEDLASVDTLLGRVDGLQPGERSPFLDSQIARFHARLAAIRGQESTEARFKLAVASFRERDVRFYLGAALLEYGEWLAERGRLDDADPVLREAGEIFEQLKAAPWIERLAKGSGDRVAPAPT
jgi:class 3 adenylate cyclase/predicted ATPase